MIITDEILAAYIDRTLPQNQVEEVRQYLASHPQEMEMMVKLMDTYHIDIKKNNHVSPSMLDDKACKASRLQGNKVVINRSDASILENLESLLQKIV
jgi:hypothetical protein